jgi:hypothetical protein
MDMMAYCVFPGESSLAAVLNRAAPPPPRVDERWVPMPGASRDDFTFDDQERGFTCNAPPGASSRDVTRWVRYADLIDNTQSTSGGVTPPAELRVGVEDIVLEADVWLPADTVISGGVTTRRVHALFTVDTRDPQVTLTVEGCDLDGGEQEFQTIASATEPIPTELAARLQGEAGASLRFEHIDFRLQLFLNDQRICALPYPVRRKDLDPEHITVKLGASGYATFTDLTLSRDLFYTRPAKKPSGQLLVGAGLIQDAGSFTGTAPACFVNYPFQVPPGHYVLMGDHSANSADSRHWHLAGYLEEGEPRVWEDAPYALANQFTEDPNPPRLDIYGRTFTPDPELADLNPDGSPILLGYWIVDGQLRRGFKDRRDPQGDLVTFIDLEGQRETVNDRSTQQVFAWAFRDQRFPPEAHDGPEAAGDSFTLLARVVESQDDGSYLAQVPRAGTQYGLATVRIPPGFARTQVPYLVWSPFVSRSQLMGKAFSVFWPGGITRGRHHALARFRYIR